MQIGEVRHWTGQMGLGTESQWSMRQVSTSDAWNPLNFTNHDHKSITAEESAVDVWYQSNGKSTKMGTVSIVLMFEYRVYYPTAALMSFWLMNFVPVKWFVTHPIQDMMIEKSFKHNHQRFQELWGNQRHQLTSSFRFHGAWLRKLRNSENSGTVKNAERMCSESRCVRRIMCILTPKQTWSPLPPWSVRIMA